MAGKAGECSRLRRFGSVVGGGALVLLTFASCGSNTIEPATVYISATIGPGSNPDAPCTIGTVMPELTIGSSANGVSTGTNGVSVICSVTPSGSGFSVSANVTGSGGSFAVSGTFPSSGTGSDITGSLEGSSAPILYSSATGGCSVVMANGSGAFPGFDPSNGPPIAGGRVWATVTCGDMTVEGQGVPADCQGILTFRLENCVGSPTTS
jgi:hypothetical protein